MSETQRLNWSFAFNLQTKDGDSKEKICFVCLFVFFFFFGWGVANPYKNKMDNDIIKSWSLTLIFKLNTKI